ncbi:MAG: hypothetical protein Q9201_005838 [Fulgogasparrea decipioides]
MAHFFTSLLPYQPIKALYLTVIYLSILLRLPLWLLLYLPRFLRQHPSYTYRQAIAIQVVKLLGHHWSVTRNNPSWTLLPGPEKDRWELIKPSAKDIYKGVLEDKEIRPVEVGGTWYPKAYGPGDREKRKAVILHFHGGAYVVGDGRIQDLGYGAGLMTRYTNCWVLGLQYRISSNPSCRFPAALQDAVTAYQSLLDRGVPASEIVLSGDSAGGNLVIALLRYIEDTSGLLPKPRAALLWCPWVCPGSSVNPHPCSSNRNYKTDFLADAFVEWGIQDYCPSGVVDPNNPYVSPMKYPFKCEGVPIWVQFGSLEILADDVVRFAEGMRGIEGNEVALHEDEGAPHDIFLVGGLLGFREATDRMGRAMGEWLRGKL